MPKIPYKVEKTKEEDEDYEIVSFEDFCDKSPNSKTDLLTLNDNINYRLCYEGDKATKFADTEGESSRDAERQSETSLNGSKNVTFKRKLSNSFAPFGRYNGKSGRAPLFSGVIPKPRNEGESTTREHRYQRFSENRNIFQRIWEHMPGMGSGALGLALLCALCVGAWWAATGAMGGAWGEEHYRKLWERAHPDSTKKPLAPLAYEKVNSSTISPPEIRYHDHNNLSTKNKNNSTEQIKKKIEPNKKRYLEDSQDLNEVCVKVADNMRFDCFPQGNANENDCANRGCCWRLPTTKHDNIPYCFYPPHYGTFRFLNMTEDKHSTYVYYEKVRASGYPDDFEVVLMHIKYVSDDAVRIKYYDALRRRFEPTFPDISVASKALTPAIKYRVKIPEDGSGIGFKVIRNSDNVTVFDTENVGGLILSDKFLQISALISSDHIFGLGERRAKFMVDMDWKTFGLFNRDRKPVENANLYGTHPYYMAVEPDGKTHGVLFINANAMDIVVQPTPAITYRTIGGILDFFVFMGPTPDDVMSQFTEIVGRPFLPPYWALGFHLCRFNYKSLNDTREVWKKNRDAGLPFDTQWNDIDYMENRNDFTYDKVKFAGLPEFVEELHKAGMHYMIIVDPGISASEKLGTYPPYDRGLELNIFIKNTTGQNFIGKVWNRQSTVFPDFTHSNITGYWVEMLSTFHSKVSYDGVWIDMNEPSNMLDGPLVGTCGPENLPYLPHVGESLLRTHTVCMDAVQFAGPHYDWHNLYGISEAMVTQFALMEIRAKRPFVISRASFLGIGPYSGHWSGDIDSAWHDMQMTIPELLNFAIFGVPMMGADICGFDGDTTVELCKRWMQLGAFYPFSRNHNSDTSKPQDPVSMGPVVLEASRKALRLRYRMLPYYYSLFWEAHLRGGAVVRPLFFQWPDNVALHPIDDQFLLGPSVMVTPILQLGANTTKAMFPGKERWYNIVDGAFIAQNTTCDVTEDQMVSVKGGTVLILQEPPQHGPVTTTNTRSSPLQLLIVPDESKQAVGSFYWDDGDSLNTYNERKYSYIEFKVNGTEMISVPLWWGHGVPPLNNITILNQPPVHIVNLSGKPCKKPKCEFTYIPRTKVLQIYNLKLSLNTQFFVDWYYEAKPELRDPDRFRGDYIQRRNKF